MNHFSKLLAVSWDPWTHGHDDVRKRAGPGTLVGIADNPKKTYAFARWERLRLAQHAMRDMDPSHIRIISGSGALYMKENRIRTLVRGCRNHIDAAEEATLRFFYESEFPGVEFETIDANPASKIAEVSSSTVKDVLRVGHNISGFVTSRVKQALESRIIRQYPVGITGEMGSGKSYVAEEIKKISDRYNIPCLNVDMDKIAHDIYGKLQEPIYRECRERLVAAFGTTIELEDGYINLGALAQIFRNDTTGEKKAELNSIMREPILHRYTKMILGKEGIILTDNALLAEFQLSYLANHHSVFVNADPETRMSRVKARYAAKGRKMSRSAIEKMLTSQWGATKKKQVLGEVIEREGNGSTTEVDNSKNASIDARKIFFGMLRNIDISGELRAGIIFELLGISEFEKEQCVATIKKKYEEAHRRHHTWEHVIEMLDFLFEYAAETNMPDEELATLGGAVLFHDSIYSIDPVYYRDNEIRSANFAKEFLERYHVRKHFIDAVYKLIYSTAHGNGVKTGDDPLALLLHDADLAVLGSTQKRYRLYVADIMDELGIAADRESREKRLKLLTKFRRDKNLYRTDMGKEQLAENAKRNLSAEIKVLKKG